MVQEKQSWLKHVFDSEYFVFWMALTCLSRYKEKGVHEYLCYKIFQTQRREVMMYYPQLFHLMLVEEESLWNRPIFRLLYKTSLEDRHFSAVLGMYALSVANSYGATEEKHRLCLDFSQIIVHTKLRCKKPKTTRSKMSLYARYLRMTYGSKVAMSPNLQTQLHQHREFYSLSERRPHPKKMKKASVASAICALLSGLAAITEKAQHEFLIGVASTNKKYGRKQAMYNNRLEIAEKNVIRDSKEASFINKLNTICNSLIPIPRQMREQALITELNLLNVYLPENICLSVLCPREKHRNILTISVELSKILDSATRAPFMLVYESSTETNIPRVIESVESPVLYEKEVPGQRKDKRQETKERIFKTAIKILGGLKELDSSAHVDLDILSIKTRVIRKIYNMHTPQHNPTGETKIKYLEDWEKIVKETQKHSPYKELEQWQLNSLIIKTGSDMKQEQLTSQILSIIDKIWEQDKISLRLNPPRTVVTGKDSGVIETLVGAKSIHQIKKYLKSKGLSQTIIEYYRERWGSSAETLEEARERFFRSLVGYSLVSYILQIKDRHNGNILVGSNGEIFHIDFGFVLGAHPGFYSVESAPFKFSIEYAEVAGKEKMERFKEEFLKGFLSIRKNMDHIIILVESVARSGGILTITPLSVHSLRDRFQPGLTIDEFSEHVSDIVDRGMKNVFTDIYDSFQYYTQGYCK